MEAVLNEVVQRHRQGIRIQGATPDHWFVVERDGQWDVRVDPWCLDYQGLLSPQERLEDILAVTSHFSHTVSRTDRLRYAGLVCGRRNLFDLVAQVTSPSQKKIDCWSALYYANWSTENCLHE